MDQLSQPAAQALGMLASLLFFFGVGLSLLPCVIAFLFYRELRKTRQAVEAIAGNPTGQIAVGSAPRAPEVSLSAFGR